MKDKRMLSARRAEPERAKAPHAAHPPPHLLSRIEALASSMPELQDLCEHDLDAVCRAVVADELKGELLRALIAARINWSEEREKFLSDCRSENTRRAYTRALSKLDAWLSHKGIAASDLGAAEADEYIRDLRADDTTDADSVRLAVAAASAFHTWLERRHREVKNPFRGTKARPEASWTVSRIPGSSEMERIMAAADPKTRAAIAIVRETGLRVGALPELTVRENGSFFTITKGKRFLGADPLSLETLGVIEAAGLPLPRPFDPAGYSGRATKRTAAERATPAERVVAQLKSRLRRLCARLLAEGEISCRYSWHDLRHAYAEAYAHQGLRWLSRRLGHASIAVTERYLRNRLAIDTHRM